MRENFNKLQINYEDFKKSFLDIMEKKLSAEDSLRDLEKHNKSIEELLQSAGGEDSFEDLRLKILQEIENNPAKFIDEYPNMVKAALRSLTARHNEMLEAEKDSEKKIALTQEFASKLNSFRGLKDMLKVENY